MDELITISKERWAQATNDIDRCLISRRTVSRFQAKTVSNELIESAIEIARWVPNHRLTEPWHFYVLGEQTAKATVELVHTITEESRSLELAIRKAKRAANVPAWVVVTSKLSSDRVTCQEDYAATCCAIHNFSLHLWDRGVAMKWCTGDLVEDQRFYSLMKINSQQRQIVGVLRIGYPIAMPTQKRKAPASYSSWLD